MSNSGGDVCFNTTYRILVFHAAQAAVFGSIFGVIIALFQEIMQIALLIFNIRILMNISSCN